MKRILPQFKWRKRIFIFTLPFRMADEERKLIISISQFMINANAHVLVYVQYCVTKTIPIAVADISLTIHWFMAQHILYQMTNYVWCECIIFFSLELMTKYSNHTHTGCKRICWIRFFFYLTHSDVLEKLWTMYVSIELIFFSAQCFVFILNTDVLSGIKEQFAASDITQI